MLTSEEMSRIVIIGPRSALREVISELHAMRVLHIREHVKTERVDIGSPLPENAALSEIMLTVSTLCNHLSLKMGVREDFRRLRVEEIDKKIEKISEEINALLNQKKELSERIISGLMARKRHLKSLTKTPELEGKAYFIGFVSGDIAPLLANLKHTLFAIPYENSHLIYLITDRDESRAVEKLLKKYSFTDIERQKEISELAGEPISMEELNNLREKYNFILSSLNKIREENYEFIQDAFSTLRLEMEKAESPLKFGSTERTFVINGWVPTRRMEDVRKRLLEITSNRLYIECENVSPEEEAPILFHHPGIISPFRFFLELYSLPKYGEIDPTFILFFTFPLFFGFMLGDIGYGLVTLALFLLLRSKLKSGRALLDVLIIASIATVIFGFVFGEFFGLEIFEHPVFHRSSIENMDNFIAIAVFMGILHIALGYIIGFFNVLKSHGPVHAVSEKLSWLLVLPSFVYILISIDILKGGLGEVAMKIMPASTVVFAMLGIGVALLLKSEGFYAIIELPGLLSNILSYARLMAIGLASLLLAAVVNDMAGPMFASGPVGWLMGILLLLIGHLINILLGILGPFLHAIRLNYVEFFTKFYQGGGMYYAPFGQLSKTKAGGG